MDRPLATRLLGPADLAEAAAILDGGGLVGVPTETVYGLAARADDGRAVARVFAAKGRPAFNPLIVHVPGAEEAEALAEVGPEALALMAAFWPGPLTLVLPLRPGAPVTGWRASVNLVALDSRLTSTWPSFSRSAHTRHGAGASRSSNASPLARSCGSTSGTTSRTTSATSTARTSYSTRPPSSLA